MEAKAPLIGHDQAIDDFLRAFASGKLHHAWLLTGDAGIGKAHFALHAAACLLSNPEPKRDANAFRSSLEQPAARQMLQGSHPDFRHLQPAPDKASQIITVEQVRSLSSLFQTTAGMGGWRVAILDAADDMNRAAANAILKLLEEPPPRSIFFLISHAPGRLLPTIRSRCRTLRFDPLTHSQVRAALVARTDEAQDDIDAVLAYADGSPGRALDYLDSHALDYAAAIERLVSGLPELDHRSLFGLADQMGDRAASPVYRICWALLQDFAQNAVRSCALEGGTYKSIPLERWLAFADGLAQGRGQIDGLNLSPRQVAIGLFSQLAPTQAHA